MRVLFDTSVLVAAMVEAHPVHERALPWLQRARAGADSGIIAMHTVAELYAVLSTLPIQSRIPPAVARRLIEQSVLEGFEVVSLSGSDYADVVAHLAAISISGGAVYDALILHAALKVGVDLVGDDGSSRNESASELKRSVRELWLFGFKEARACIFPVLFFAILFLSNYVPLFGLARYDFIFLATIGVQASLLLARIETRDEVLVLCVFHAIGLGLEVLRRSRPWAPGATRRKGT